jgi:two-component sensor histidine kinase
MPGCDVFVSAQQGLVIRTDRAIPAVLLVNELVTNAAKYAYPGGQCQVWVTLSYGAEETVMISVRDEGVGLPDDFDLKSGRRLGMRLVDSLSQQLQGALQALRRNPGTEFILTIPLRPRS